MTRATIGMLDPGTSDIAFQVQTILTSGSGSGSDNTNSLPPSVTMTNIANISFTKNGKSVTYTADALVKNILVGTLRLSPHPTISITPQFYHHL
ncbi:hypothetical protein ACEPPN_001014 [Leptodophora sp. 'Broadleaf-Isolate-01']